MKMSMTMKQTSHNRIGSNLSYRYVLKQLTILPYGHQDGVWKLERCLYTSDTESPGQPVYAINTQIPDTLPRVWESHTYSISNRFCIPPVRYIFQDKREGKPGWAMLRER